MTPPPDASPLEQMSDQELAHDLDRRAKLYEKSPTGWALSLVNLPQTLREAARRLRAERRCEAVYCGPSDIVERCDLPLGHEQNHLAERFKERGASFQWPLARRVEEG